MAICFVMKKEFEMADIKDKKIEDEKIEEEKKSELEKKEQQRKDEEKKQEALSGLEAQLKSLSDKYGNEFNAEAYTAAAKNYIEEHNSLENFNASSFVKEKEDKDNDKNEDKKIENEKGLSFSLKEKDGKFTAIGSDGTVLEGKSFEEINDKVCQNMKQKAEAEGIENTICFNGKSPEEQKIFSRNAIMKHDVTILGGYPKDPQFCKDLKNEYLADKSHSLQDWERMTRKIPDDVMQRTPEEQARNKKLLDADLLKKLRKGINPNDTMGAASNVPPAPLNINQAAEQRNNVPGTTKTPNTPVANNTPNIPGTSNVPNTPGVTNEAGTVGQSTGEQVGDQKSQDRNLVAQMRRGINPNSPEYQAQMAAEEQRRQNPQELTPQMQEEIKRRAQEKNK